MQRREIMLDTLERTDFRTTARLRLRYKQSDGIVVGSDLRLDATLSDELSERIRFEVEKEIASLIGDDVETFSDGTVSPPEFAEIDF